MASERLLSMAVFMVVMVMGAIHMQSSDAQTTTHIVGGPLGWSIPTTNANAYATWAASQTFKVGDVLVFNYTTGTHTAAEVTKAAYDACTVTNPITVWNTGPSSVTLNTSGAHYYLCTITGHCSAGQKLAITVAAAASPTPAPTPSATPPTPTPTPSATPTPTPTPSPSPTTSPTPAPTPASSPSPSPASAPTPSGTPTPAPGSSATPSGPAPGSSATPSGVPAPGAADTPPDSASSASFLSAALPLTILSMAIAFYY